jgi:hypothetical protein
MSAEDPSEELQEILKRVKSGALPQSAATWAAECLDTVESILDSDSPSFSQDEALGNIYRGACRWLHRKPAC